MTRSYTREEVIDIIDQGARNRGIPTDDFLRFAYAETGGRLDPNATHGSTAKGLFQFVPATAQAYGIAGREMDPVANTDAAARLYLDNKRAITQQHGKDGFPYLSGKADPDGLDMYVAHQQGAAGYNSIQTALQTGHFSLPHTRAHILNNINSAEFTQLTGKDYGAFTKMSDKDMAAAYVQYWDAKFHGFPIPERQAAPQPPPPGAPQSQTPVQPHPQPGAAQPAPTASEEKPGITLDSGYALSQQYDHVRYQMGAKHPESGKVDCSGWVVVMQNATMDEINRKAGRQVFAKGDHFSAAFDGAAMIVEKAQKESGVLIEGHNISKDVLKEGMVIGEHNGSPNGKGRFHGIDHITMVVRDPNSGELMISQSSSHKGVHLMPIDDYLNSKRSHGVELYATDPLAKARDLIQDRQPTHAQAQPAPSHARKESHASQPLLREGDHGPAVKELQAQLREMGYRGADGQPLKSDGSFGPNTKAALQAYQRDHRLEADGIAGPRTNRSLQGHAHDAARETPRLDQPGHPDHKLFKQAQDAVHRLDAQHGRQPDPASDNMAGSLAVAAKKAGLTSVDHVVLSEDRSRLYAVQGSLNSPFKQMADVPTAQAAQTSLQQSSEAMREVNQHQTQQGHQAHHVQQQQQQQAMTASR